MKDYIMEEFGWEKMVIILMVVGMVIGGPIIYYGFKIHDMQSVVSLGLVLGASINVAVYSVSLLSCGSDYIA